MRAVVFLACALSFATVHEAEAGAVRAQLSARVSKVKVFFTNKLPLLRKSAMVAALIYAGGMFPPAAVGDNLSSSRPDEMVIISQNNDEMLLMPVRGWLPQTETLNGNTLLIVSPNLVRRLAQTLATFVVADDKIELVVSRMLSYWDVHLGKRAVDLRAAVAAVRLAREGWELETWNVNTERYEGYPIEILKQRLAFLTLAELTAGLNAALVRENGLLGISTYAAFRLLSDYIESGYVMVEIDDLNRAKMVYPRLYNHSSEDEILVAKIVRRRDYDRVMDIAIVNNHFGVMSLLLSVNERHGYVYDPHQHLEKATELRRIQMVKALLAEVQEHRNRALDEAAYRGDLLQVESLLASGADDLNEALLSAVRSRRSNVVDFLVTFDGIDFNDGLSVAAVNHILAEVERFSKLGADNFDEALQKMLEFTPYMSDAAKLLLARATNFNAALRSLLLSEDVFDHGFKGDKEVLARMLIRAGANDLKGILDDLHSDEIGYPDHVKRKLKEDLLRIFAEESPQQLPAQLPIEQR